MTDRRFGRPPTRNIDYSPIKGTTYNYLQLSLFAERSQGRDSVLSCPATAEGRRLFGPPLDPRKPNEPPQHLGKSSPEGVLLSVGIGVMPTLFRSTVDDLADFVSGGSSNQPQKDWCYPGSVDMSTLRN